MAVFNIELIEKHETAQHTYQFDFSKPPEFSFLPGQFGAFILPMDLGLAPQNLNRRFSFISRPHDSKISIAMRITENCSPYKQTFLSLALGTNVKLAGPQGNFVLTHPMEKPVVFIAGGIGITPFLCMIRSTKELNNTLHLFHLNQIEAAAAYQQELMNYAGTISSLKFIPITGYFNNILLTNILSNFSECIYYICGSLKMINHTKAILHSLNIPEDQIRTEDFPGY